MLSIGRAKYAAATSAWSVNPISDRLFARLCGSTEHGVITQSMPEQLGTPRFKD